MSKSPFYIAGMSTGLNLSNLGKANGLANFDKEAFLKSVAQTPEQYLQSFNKPKNNAVEPTTPQPLTLRGRNAITSLGATYLEPQQNQMTQSTINPNILGGFDPQQLTGVPNPTQSFDNTMPQNNTVPQNSTVPQGSALAKKKCNKKY